MNNNLKQAVSVIGLGSMGTKIAEMLLHSGYEVTVWNRTSTKADALVKAGASLAPSAAAAISASPTTIICVYDYEAADAILKTEEISNILPDRTLIQLTTGSPDEAIEAERWAHQYGADYIEGALQVAPDQMGLPDTTILLSGAKEAYNRSEPLLGILGGNLTYLGESIGAASAMDLATLSCLYGAILGFFHGARISESGGFGVDTYGEIIAKVFPNFGEFLKHEGAVIQSGNFAVSQSPLGISVEATERLVQTAQVAGINAEFPIYAAGVLKRAAAAGYANEELAAVIKVLRD